MYRTMLPMLTSLLLVLNGTWWLQMAFSFFLLMDTIDPKYFDGDHAYAYMYGVLFNHVLSIVISAALGSMLLKRWDLRAPGSAAPQTPRDVELHLMDTDPDWKE